MQNYKSLGTCRKVCPLFCRLSLIFYRTPIYCFNKPSPKNPFNDVLFRKGCKIEGVNDIEFVDHVGDEVQLKIVSGRMVFKNGELQEDVVLRGTWPYKNQIEHYFKNHDKGIPTFDFKGQEWTEIFFNRNGLPRYRKERNTQIISSIIDEAGIPNYGSEDIAGLLGKKEQEVVVHFDYVNGLISKIDQNIAKLSSQMKGYTLIENRNKLYSQILAEYIRVAKVKFEELYLQKDDIDPNDVFDMTDYNVRKEMLERKIRTLESSYRIMEGHYISVGMAILSTNSVINTLNHVRNDFIPLLSSNMLISIGATSAQDANEIARNVVALTKSYLSDNLDTAREILGDLQVLGVPEDHIKRISGDIDSRLITDGEEQKIRKIGSKD